MRETLHSAADVIKALGGLPSVVRLTSAKSVQVVSNWRRFGRFPPRTYLVLTGALAEIGKTAPASLWGMDEAAPRPTAPSEGRAVA